MKYRGLGNISEGWGIFRRVAEVSEGLTNILEGLIKLRGD